VRSPEPPDGGETDLMSATLTVIWWRDIPAQIVAKDRRQSHKIVLHPRFQVAIDRAAKQAGLEEWGAYLEQWRKEQRICSDDVKAEAEAEALRLETDYPKDVLNRLIRTGGFAEPRPEVATAERP
jgi:hypothetical protein